MNWQTIQASLPMVKETQNVKVKTPTELAALCQDLQNLAQECFQTITIDSKNNVIDRHLITLGLMDSSLVHPREIFRSAILDNAHSILLVHNHPSGDPTPSAEDIRITRQIIQAGKIIDIKVIDHTIIGRPSFYSMREAGLCDFS